MQLREKNMAALDGGDFDVLIVGGGINGAVSAAALAARGVKVALIDRGDFAGGSSSNSSNLAWGGIKYLESGEFLLVSKLCRSRNHLMQHYPSSVREIRFFTTIRKGFRMPAFFVYLGALLYWFIGACRTRAPRYLSAGKIKREEPGVNTENVAGGLEYSDCYLPDNDARFVFRFVRRAMETGCVAANYVEATDARYENDLWRVTLRDQLSGRSGSLKAKVLINACGPWVDSFNQQLGETTEHRHVFSKGVHLIVERLVEQEKILAFFASDGRLFFVIPMGPKTCIGTTDTRVESPWATITDEDRHFILDNVNQLLDLEKPLMESDIIAERCGVRPLVVKNYGGDTDDWLSLSRKHAIDVNPSGRFVSIFGGKLTDCINVGEEVSDIVESLGVSLQRNGKEQRNGERWYGEPDPALKADFLQKAGNARIDDKIHTLSGEPLSERIWRRYGALAFQLLEQIDTDPCALEKPIEEIEYTRCEIQLMAQTEMIASLDDFLRRRSKVTQVLSEQAVLSHPGLAELSQLLFGDRGEAQIARYREAVSKSNDA